MSDTLSPDTLEQTAELDEYLDDRLSFEKALARILVRVLGLPAPSDDNETHEAIQSGESIF